MPAAGTKVQLRLGERVVAEVAFEGAELRIGRMKENDLVINNLAVSRFHAVLRRLGDGFEIEDLGSENGTLVDGVAVRGTAAVSAGAAITIGKHTLALRSGGGEARQQPAPQPPGSQPAVRMPGTQPAKAGTRPPLAHAAKSDVWDAAQTYFVAAPAAALEPAEEAVAVAVEADRDDDGAPDAEEAPELAAAPLEPPPLAPEPLELEDEAGALAFDEDELVGEAAPDPVAAEAADVSIEAAGLEPLELPSLPVPAPGPTPPRTEAGGQTALFDFGLTDDLGISDRSLAHAARGRSAGPAPVRAAEPVVAPAPALHAGLIVERLGRVERVVAWGAVAIVAGRSPDCDLVLAATGVSRRHARFEREGDAFRVVDLASANGVRVNGKRLESAALAVGDVVAIDDFTLTFVLDREPVEAMVHAAPAPGARRRGAQGAAPAAMPERDLLLEAEDEVAPLDAEKELELAAALAEAPAAADVAASWRFEIAIATDQLPAALRRALAELGEDELRLPAALRLVRRA